MDFARPSVLLTVPTRASNSKTKHHKTKVDVNIPRAAVTTIQLKRVMVTENNNSYTNGRTIRLHLADI